MCICDHVAFSSTIEKWSKSSYLFFFLLHKNLSFVYIPEFDFLFRGGSGVWCFINKSEQQSKATISKCSKQ